MLFDNFLPVLILQFVQVQDNVWPRGFDDTVLLIRTRTYGGRTKVSWKLVRTH